MVIYTIGSSSRKLEEFIGLLKHYQLQVLIDVRRFPKSKFEHFKQENLKKAIESEGIQYLWLGQELGGYRRGGYERYTETEEFKKGINKIREIAKEKRIIIMCAERLPWRCHRRFIGDNLSKLGYQISHIIEKDKIWQPNQEKEKLKR
jgi:uncharacterized protein (DUF488 family)